MMARILSQTLIREASLSSKSHHLSSCSRLVNHRNRSNRSEKAQMIEIDLEGDNSDVEILGLRRLEDTINGIMAQRSAPEWLPFLPGSSYWVPPRKSPLGLVELVRKLANPFTEEETLALSSVRAWPSSSYFVEGASPQYGETNSKTTTTESEDEEESEDE
ncbi:uncharacterized protein LOC143849601 [Tasmannia lanceolata]|uniref:uncharacterized protein LOC143849601 n=1 Tax=Tasmannia lanceolata TaxID=3420 RepID=UPI0040634CF1